MRFKLECREGQHSEFDAQVTDAVSRLISRHCEIT